MALKELQIRNIRPTDKVTQCTDERGLYLEVHPNGSKLWRYKYRYMGKQKRLALGRYPDVGLAEARKRRDDARRLLETGTDPLAERKHEKLVAVFQAANTFGEIAKEYIDKQVAQGQADTTTQKANWLLEHWSQLPPARWPTSSPSTFCPRSSRLKPGGIMKRLGVADPLPVACSAMPSPPDPARAIPAQSCAARLSCRRSGITRQF